VPIGVFKILAARSFEFEPRQEVEFVVRQLASFHRAVKKVAELCEALERFLDGKKRQTVAAMVEHGNLPSFAPAPFKELSLQSARDRKREVRFALLQFLGMQELQQETDRLLGNILFRKRGLVLRDAADTAMQHRNKRQD